MKSKENTKEDGRRDLRHCPPGSKGDAIRTRRGAVGVFNGVGDGGGGDGGDERLVSGLVIGVKKGLTSRVGG